MAGQSPITINDIIINAYNLIGEISPSEPIKADQMSRGLFLLNDLVASFSNAGVYIPFITKLEWILTPGQAEYRVSDIITTSPDIQNNRIVSLEYVQVIQTTTSFPIKIIPRAEIFNNYFQVQLSTRPSYVYLDRQNLYDTIIFYPIPDYAYDAIARCKLILNQFEINQQLDNVPNYYYRFLRYALARELISYYPSSNWNEQAESEYSRMLKAVTTSNDFDMTIVQDVILMHPYGRFISNNFGFLP